MSDTIRVSRELLPCPFCSNSDIDDITVNLASRRRRYAMLCRVCGCRSDEHKTKKGARLYWNTRALLSQPAEQHSDPIQSIATQLGIMTFGDGLLTKIRETVDLLQSDANNLNQFREITAEQYGHLSAATKLNEALQSELNEARTSIAHLLIELDELKAPRHGHCNHGPEKTCGRCTAERR